MKWHHTYVQANKTLDGYFKATQISLSFIECVDVLFEHLHSKNEDTLCSGISCTHRHLHAGLLIHELEAVSLPDTLTSGSIDSQIKIIGRESALCLPSPYPLQIRYMLQLRQNCTIDTDIWN